MTETMARTELDGGGIRLSARKCTFEIRRLADRVLQVTIVGRDSGQFGSAVFDEIRRHFFTNSPLELFVDASDAHGATTEVSDAWTRFLNKEAGSLKRVTILAVSKFVHLTVSVAKLFSRTGDLIQIYSDPSLFHSAIKRAVGRP
jgi:hypothetical protein